MFEKQSYPKSSPSLPKSTMSASGRETLGLTGLWWRQTPIAGTGTHRVRSTHAAPTGCTNTTYAPHYNAAGNNSATGVRTLSRFPRSYYYRSYSHHHQLQLSQTPRGERSRVCGGPEFRQFEEVFEFLSFTIRGIFRAFQVSQFK